ncbi:MAG: helix-turn-helix transcriptional regulator [Coriobacteriales bacterium]|nr:helix-turn-helix transcriptional regulator [Coriobacteriales bacterium]
MGVLRHASSVVGFAAHWAWVWCLFWSSLFYSEGPLIAGLGGGLFSLEPLWTLSLLANACGLVVFLLVSYFKNPLGDKVAAYWLCAAIKVAGTLMVSHPFITMMGTASTVTYPIGAVITGFGSAGLFAFWGEYFASLGSRQTILRAVPAMVLGSMVYLLIAFVPTDAAQIFAASLPLISICCLIRAKRSDPRRTVSFVTSVKVRLKERPPVRLIAISLFFGFFYGIMKGLFALEETAVIEMRDLVFIAAVCLGSIALYVTTVVFRMDFDRLTYQIALPLMAACFIFLPWESPFALVGAGFHQLGYQYFYIILWAIWPVLARRGDVPEGWVVCWGLSSIQFGQFFGSALSAGMIAVLEPLQMGTFCSLAIFTILLIALFSFGDTSAKTGWGFLKPLEEGDAVSAFRRACMQVAAANRLSPRETEVLVLLSRGHDRSYIGKKLVISDETAKSHFKSIYRKIGVHSQQEIIRAVEEQIRILR